MNEDALNFNKGIFEVLLALSVIYNLKIKFGKYFLGICVANHTSPIDVMILGADNIYALIGQRHTGVLGLLQRALSRASSHIWFERSEARDRKLVTRT